MFVYNGPTPRISSTLLRLWWETHQNFSFSINFFYYHLTDGSLKQVRYVMCGLLYRLWLGCYCIHGSLRKSLVLKHHTANKILPQELFGLAIYTVSNQFLVLNLFHPPPPPAVVFFPSFYQLYLTISTHLSVFLFSLHSDRSVLLSPQPAARLLLHQHAGQTGKPGEHVQHFHTFVWQRKIHEFAVQKKKAI